MKIDGINTNYNGVSAMAQIRFIFIKVQISLICAMLY
jgi:hypothetical protein